MLIALLFLSRLHAQETTLRQGAFYTEDGCKAELRQLEAAYSNKQKEARKSYSTNYL